MMREGRVPRSWDIETDVVVVGYGYAGGIASMEASGTIGTQPGAFPADYEALLKQWLKDYKGITLHRGGLLDSEGLFLGQSSEGVLTRRAMQNIGMEGLNRLNSGQAVGNSYTFVINALDGADVERVLEEKIIPSLKRKSAAGVEILHERGLKRAMA